MRERESGEMEIGFGGTDSGFQGAVKSLDSHFAKADALLQVILILFQLEFELEVDVLEVALVEV